MSGESCVIGKISKFGIGKRVRNLAHSHWLMNDDVPQAATLNAYVLMTLASHPVPSCRPLA
jgi:hypothetical protein